MLQMLEGMDSFDRGTLDCRQTAEKIIKCADRRIFILEAAWKNS
jgi:hypothetical protein